MAIFLMRIIPVFSLLFFFPLLANSEMLSGNIGVSKQSDAGWLNLSKITRFKKGDRVKITVGGTAKKIVLRFLSKNTDPNTPAGVDGGIIEIPENRVIDIVLQENHDEVEQISVHGGTNPWGLFFLGEQNGPASILNARHRLQLQPELHFGWED